MKVGVLRERGDGERRVALVPDAIGRLGAGIEVVVEAGAGLHATVSDEDYRTAGAQVAQDLDQLLAADLLVGVGPPAEGVVERLREGAVVVGLLQPLTNDALVDRLARQRVTAISMDAIPRIARAQAMDALSSQSTVAGYKAVITAAALLPRFFPLLMTAAGTVPPARVLVLGAGVAGLQAIGTARRLGAVVSAFDTRPVVKEQVESLGASFLQIELEVSGAEDERGYATALDVEAHAAEERLVARHVAQSDVVITTALIPGRPAPELISEEAVQSMRTGSVIVDLAADAGGNCALTVPGETVVRHGVAIVGTRNVPATVPLHASQMYARNVVALLGLLARNGELELDFDDEIIADACITHAGERVSRLVRAAS